LVFVEETELIYIPPLLSKITCILLLDITFAFAYLPLVRDVL
jgi:hypothetical protein